MTNPDTSTLNGALEQLGITMAANLTTKGVPASASDGLTTLAGKILDIEPSVGGLDLTSEMSLTASSNSISLGQSVVLTATLTANYDDETLVNVDLHGYLQGATVSFKNGDTVIDTATTDVNGVASYTYTPSSAGTLSLTAVFSGTDNFSSATSSSVSVVVSAPTPASVSLSADKSVLSYYHSESATLSATVLDSNSSPVESATVEFFKGSTSLGTASTNSSGIATKSYASTGSGDVSFTAECSSIVSETYSLEDCTFYDATEHSYTKGSGNYYSAITGAISITGNFEWSMDMKHSNVSASSEARVFLANNTHSASSQPNYALWQQFEASSKVNSGSRRSGSTISSTATKPSVTNDTYVNFKCTRTSNNFAFDIGGNTLDTLTETWFDNYSSYYLTCTLWKSGTITIKNIKIKAL